MGKSILVTALCRILKQDGFRVAPFKSQNMALNSFVTKDGGEMGRAQVTQAEAAGLEPTVDMNPILLKPEADARSQVIVRGKVSRTISASRYYRHTPHLLKVVEESLNKLRSAYDVVLIEGAGSPAEINLKEREIVNMRIARMAQAPVLLCGDIDRGGVFASLVGDSVYLDERQESVGSADLDIAVIHLPHISNYDDFDPLEDEGCRARYITQAGEIGNPHLIIIPGTKSTASDLLHLWRSGLAESIIRQSKNGTPVIGICGGYQILGRSLLDPQRAESETDGILGLGLLDVTTTFATEKSTRQVRGKVAASRGLLEGTEGEEVVGYEIHMGQTEGSRDMSALHIHESPQGIVDYFIGQLNPDGTVLGTYMHGLFHNAGFRKALLNNLRRRCGLPEKAGHPVIGKEDQYDRLAALVRHSLDMNAVYRILEKGMAK